MLTDPRRNQQHVVSTIIQKEVNNTILSVLLFVTRTLGYGIYKLRYIMRMWDSNVADPLFTHKLPFEKDVFTYIEIK